MKKLITALVLLGIASTATYAAKGDATKEKFMDTQKAQYEKKGWPWDQEKVEAMFNAIDTNADGIASGDEKKAYWANNKKGASKTPAAATPAAPAKKPAKGDSTKEQYMENQRKNAEKKGVEFNEKKAEKMFEQLDTNGDGIASGDEKKAYWNK